jgi:hypothetical protein
MVDLYIYYRVAEHNAASLASLVQAMQAQLAEGHGVAVQLKRRPDAVDGMQTWMEVYPGAADGFAQALDAAVEAAALDSFIFGARHTEIFTDIIPCA